MQIDLYTGLEKPPFEVHFASAGLGTQVFRGDTLPELLAKLCQAHAHLLGSFYILRQERAGTHVGKLPTGEKIYVR